MSIPIGYSGTSVVRDGAIAGGYAGIDSERRFGVCLTMWGSTRYAIGSEKCVKLAQALQHSSIAPEG
jgi:hypothetical protein